MRRTHIVIAAALTLPVMAACGPAPRSRPVKMGPVDTGPESAEAIRRQLQGTWDLTTLEMFQPSGAKSAVQATGRLTYDEFGNLAMRGSVSGANVDSSVLNLTGRVAIDPVAHTLKFGGLAAPTADAKRLDPQLDASQVRYYEITGDTLKTTIKAADGSPTAVATWMRVK